MRLTTRNQINILRHIMTNKIVIKPLFTNKLFDFVDVLHLFLCRTNHIIASFSLFLLFFHFYTTVWAKIPEPSVYITATYFICKFFMTIRTYNSIMMGYPFSSILIHSYSFTFVHLVSTVCLMPLYSLCSFTVART